MNLISLFQKSWKRLLACAAVLIISNSAYASCTSLPIQTTPNMVNFGTIKAKIWTPGSAGRVLGTYRSTTYTVPGLLGCTGVRSFHNPIAFPTSAGTISFFGPYPVTGSTTLVHQTNIPGIGIYIDSYNMPTNVGNTAGKTAGIPVDWNQTNSITNGGFIVYIVQYGPVLTSGTIPGGPLSQVLFGSQVAATLNGGPITIIGADSPTCSVSTPSVAVQLGAVSQSVFRGVGSTSPPSAPFNISLNCAGGDGSTTTQVSVTLTDATDPANRSDILSLSSTGSGAATGIGVQVKHGTNVVSYGPDSAAAGNQNQWVAGSTNNGTFNIPLTASYIQTAATVTPGTANAIATFTMSYQ